MFQLQLVITEVAPPYSGSLLSFYVQGIYAYRNTTQCNASTVVKQQAKLSLPLRFVALEQEPANELAQFSKNPYYFLYLAVQQQFFIRCS